MECYSMVRSPSAIVAMKYSFFGKKTAVGLEPANLDCFWHANWC